MPSPLRNTQACQDSAADNGFLADGMPEARSFGSTAPLPYDPVTLRNYAVYAHEAPRPFPGKPLPRPKPPVNFTGLIRKWEDHNAR
jgi:hypothetical protein